MIHKPFNVSWFMLFLVMLCISTACTRPFMEGEPTAIRINYGHARSQYGELRFPIDSIRTVGRTFPVVLLIHGGCWLADYDLDYIRPLASKLTKLGFATWTLEYRRLGEAGGGWPGTLQDVGAGMDYLRVLNQRYPLDLANIVVAGHSAGGQLALWLTGRATLSVSSEIHGNRPLLPKTVLGLAAISDITDFARGSSRCNRAAAQLLGGSSALYPGRYRDAQPPVPAGIRVLLLHGENDDIVPIDQSRRYVVKRQRHGQAAKFISLAGVDHFDIVDPEGSTWLTISEQLRER